MDRKTQMACWLYNLNDVEGFKVVMKSEGIVLDVDFDDDSQVNSMTTLITSRIQQLESGTILMSFPDDIRSFTYLRLAAAMSMHGKSWYAQKETEIFSKRIQSLTASDIISFVNGIMTKEQSIDIVSSNDDVNYQRDYNRSRSKIKSKWYRFPELMPSRKFTVSKGWIYTYIDEIIPGIVKTFKDSLESSVNDASKKFASNNSPVIAAYANMLDSMIDVPTVPDGSSVSDIISISPSCMRILDSNISKGVDIGYIGHLILSFYLKTYMSRDDLVEYFYRRNPSNVSTYSSVDSYLSARHELDYIFKQMYGELGGGTNYASFACKRIADEGYCPFASMNGSNPDDCHDRVMGLISMAETVVPIDDATMNRIVAAISNIAAKGHVSRACGMEFQSRFDQASIESFKNSRMIGSKKYVAHPVKAYLDDALKVKNPPENSRDRPASEASESNER